MKTKRIRLYHEDGTEIMIELEPDDGGGYDVKHFKKGVEQIGHLDDLDDLIEEIEAVEEELESQFT